MHDAIRSPRREMKCKSVMQIERSCIEPNLTIADYTTLRLAAIES